MRAQQAIAIVGDNEVVSQSTILLLKRARQKVHAFAGGAEFLAWEAPDSLGCILLDLHLAGTDPLAFIRALERRGSTVPVLLLARHGDVPMIVEAMSRGAADFLERPYSPALLLDAVRRARAGGQKRLGRQSIDPRAKSKVDGLSRRQHAVLRRMLKGQPNKIIAWELSLSVRTVETYRAHMLTRLGAGSTADAIRLAIAAGLGNETADISRSGSATHPSSLSQEGSPDAGVGTAISSSQNQRFGNTKYRRLALPVGRIGKNARITGTGSQ